MAWLNDNLSENVRYSYPEYPAYIDVISPNVFPGGSHTMHWHDDIEFLYFLSGGDDYTVNGQKIPLTAGEGIFINSRQMHYGTPTKDSRVLCIRLNPGILCMSLFFESNYILPVIQNSNMPYIRLSPDTEWQKNLLDALCRIYRHCGKHNPHLHLHGLFCYIWAQLYENMPDSSRSARSSDDLTVIETMLEFVEQHYAEKITLSQIAVSGHICESKCCRLFKQYVHKTPNLYLTHYRLGKAAELLTGTDRSITEIALSCGFSGASYFAETFRKYFRVTPKEYRENAGK